MLTITGLCWLCRQPLHLAFHGICCFCLRHLPMPPPCCFICGLPSSQPELPCGRCLQQPRPWQRILFIGDYQPPLSTLIKMLKFKGFSQLAPVLARLIFLRWRAIKYADSAAIKPQRLISVPLHHRRCWQRGFNQSDLLARPLARWLGCDYHPDSLKRLSATPPQRQLTASARRKNLRGIFRLTEDFCGQHVVLLDDVVTTGSTVAEISAMLREQKVSSLQVWCICRTL
ncbi:DNA utilization protein GntX [Yersinia nurmii]|uniref:DNA utilization protein GntX n=1 Tax=Yersinia nurmii TaxID=685706 RepID=A0AAW7JUY9_9GAMM|nr:DNA utilization protein GntX [Yersinia nurmii]MDN0086797.1 DNA utilization protein GntX [Yersinia nurmii]